jgi:FkbM family methyltransferase
MLSRLSRIISRHWSERRHYATTRDWWMSIYNRVLIHLPGAPLPGRGRVREVHLNNANGTATPPVVRLATSDWYVLEEMFINGEYEYVRELLGPQVPKLIVDLGANVGMSVRLWQTLYPGVKVVAVEPDADNLRIAQRNVLNTQPPPTLVRACVAGRRREVSLDRSKNAYSISMRDDASDGSADRVPAVPLLDLLADAWVSGPIDLLKCDIEGAEAEVFADCAAWLNTVRHITIELHAPYTREKFLADLSRNGGRFAVRHETNKGDLHVMSLSNENPPAVQS